MNYGYQLQQGIVCRFRQGGLSPWERSEALATFRFKGTGHDEDVSRRLSVYDTEMEQRFAKWDDATRAEVEDRLRNGMAFGTSYIEVQQPRVPAPWPTYDKLTAQGRRTVEMVAEKIAETASELGLDIGHVLAYERENGNRSEVIAALEALGAPKAEEEPVVSA